MNNLRVGVIGCGYWGPNLIRNFIEIPTADLVIIADLQQKNLDRMTDRFPQIPHTTQDYKELFEMDLDAIVVATPPQTHAKLVTECLEQGHHVLVEKPITLDVNEAEALVRVAEENDRILMVGHTFEYNSSVRALKQMIDSGELGDIYYIDAVRASLGLFQTHANVMWDLAPHDISIFHYLLGEEAVSVSARGADCVGTGIDSVGYATLKFPNNVLAHIRASWLDPSKTRRITVVGSEKMVIYDDVEPLEKIRVYDKRVQAIRHTETFGEFQFAYHYGDVTIPFIRQEEPLRAQCTHFLDCIRNGETPRSDGHNGLRVVKVLEAIDESLKLDGAPVQINGKTHVATNGRVAEHELSALAAD
jgi:predicted dehydrogenase